MSSAEACGQAYVLRVPSNFMITLAAGTELTCAEAVTALLRHKRRREIRSAGRGSKGQRWYAWAWLATASPRHHLLIRRHLRTGELPGSPGALLHRGPLRTVHATLRGTRPKQAARAVQVVSCSTEFAAARAGLRVRLQAACTRCVRSSRGALGVL